MPEATIAAHREKLRAVRHALWRDVNQVLKKHGVGLTLHSLKFMDRAGTVQFGCCKINGVTHCGPECG